MTFFKNSRLSGQIAGLNLWPDLATVHMLWELVGQIEPDGSVGRPRKKSVAIDRTSATNGPPLILTRIAIRLGLAEDPVSVQIFGRVEDSGDGP